MIRATVIKNLADISWRAPSYGGRRRGWNGKRTKSTAARRKLSARGLSDVDTWTSGLSPLQAARWSRVPSRESAKRYSIESYQAMSAPIHLWILKVHLLFLIPPPPVSLTPNNPFPLEQACLCVIYQPLIVKISFSRDELMSFADNF